MKTIALLSALFACFIAGTARADGVQPETKGIKVEEWTLDLDKLTPEMRKAICERETKIVKEQVKVKTTRVRNLKKKSETKVEPAKADKTDTTVVKEAKQENQDLTKLIEELDSLKKRVDKLEGSVDLADLAKMRLDIDTQIQTVSELLIVVQEIRRETKPVGIGVALGYAAWQSRSGLKYGAPTLELRYDWPAAKQADVYLAVAVGVWPKDKNPFSFTAKTGLTIPLHENFGLRVGADLGAYAVDTQLKARCYLLAGDVGPVWKPIGWLEVEASGLAGSTFAIDSRPAFTYGGQGAVRVKF